MITPGARPSPNIWGSPATYEIENQAFDRAGLVASALCDVAPFDGLDVLDIGCGTGFHLPWFASSARSVTGVEPHGGLAAIARRRTRALPSVTVLHGSATDLPLPPASVDVVHARWAYFFGPGCEPGLAEVDRVMRRGGVAVVIDNDASRSTWGEWFRRGFPMVDPSSVEAFWSSRGWTRLPVLTAWDFHSRADLDAVVRIELPGGVAEDVLAAHEGLRVEYAVNLWWKRF